MSGDALARGCMLRHQRIEQVLREARTVVARESRRGRQGSCGKRQRNQMLLHGSLQKVRRIGLESRTVLPVRPSLI